MQVVLIVALMGFVHLLFWDRFSGDSYFANIMSAYQVCGAEHIGAGVVGTLFVYPLQKFIGVAGYESNHRLRICLHSYESNLTIEVC